MAAKVAYLEHYLGIADPTGQLFRKLFPKCEISKRYGYVKTKGSNVAEKRTINKELLSGSTHNDDPTGLQRRILANDLWPNGCLESLPSELQRNFNLMRELDSRTQDEVKNIDCLTDDYLNYVSHFTPEIKTEKIDKIHKMFKKAQDYADDKVQLAMQTYEMVDKHIRRLDADLARFEADLKDKALNLHSTDSDSSHKKKGRKFIEKLEKKKGRRPSSDDENSKFMRKKHKGPPIQPEINTPPLTITHPSDVLDMPVDPNEPTYCLCHQVSYGEMIGCDNPDCPIEWFHFACVGLTSKPKGKWYCFKCSSERKKKLYSFN